MRAVLDSLIGDPSFIRKIEENAYTDSGTLIESELVLEKGSYVLDANGDKHEVHSVKFSAKCRKDVIEADLLKGRYGETAIVMASGTSFGRVVQMVFTEQNDGESPTVSVRIKKKK